MKKPISGAAEGSSSMHNPRAISGKNDFLNFPHVTQLVHADFALGRRGEGAHDRWLNDGNQGHVRVGRHSDSAQKVGRELAGQEDRRGTVSAADDTDGCRIEKIEMNPGDDLRQNQRTDECAENAELGGGAQ